MKKYERGKPIFGDSILDSQIDFKNTKVSPESRKTPEAIGRASHILVYDFLQEADGHGISEEKQPWKDRQTDDHRLHRDQLEIEKLTCSDEERVCRRERDI